MATFKVKRGDSWAKDFTWRSGAADGPVIPFPVGTTARMHVRDPDTGELKIALSTETSGLTLNAAGGLVSASISTSQTEALDEKSYLFDIELTYPDGQRRSTETQTLKIGLDQTYG